MAEVAEANKPPRRRRSRRGEATRQRILTACVVCLNESGYAATSIEAVMNRTGVSRGSVLHQFPTRLDLMVAVSEMAMRRLMEDTQSRFEAMADPVRRYRHLSRIFWETQSLPEAIAVTELLLAARWDKELTASLKAVAETIEVEIDEDVRRFAMEAGVTDIDACLVHARSLILSLRGVTLELMFDPDRKAIHQALAHIHALHDEHCARVMGET